MGNSLKTVKSKKEIKNFFFQISFYGFQRIPQALARFSGRFSTVFIRFSGLAPGGGAPRPLFHISLGAHRPAHALSAGVTCENFTMAQKWDRRAHSRPQRCAASLSSVSRMRRLVFNDNTSLQEVLINLTVGDRWHCALTRTSINQRTHLHHPP